MRYETRWANTGRSIPEEWRSGIKGHCRLAATVEDSLHTPEVSHFLEGMDRLSEEPEPISSKGFLVTLSRMFLFTLPSHRIR